MLCFMKVKSLIEVARFMSSRSDAAGAEEGLQKGRAPKGHIPVSVLLGHRIKSLMTVIFWMGSYRFT